MTSWTAPPTFSAPLRVLPAEPAAAEPLPSPTEERISLQELRRLWDQGEPVIILDVRRERALAESDSTAQGAVRLDPDRAVADAGRLKLPKEAWLIAFCA